MTLLSLAGIWSRLGTWISAAFTAIAGVVTRYPWQALVVFITLACGVLVWRVDRLDAAVKLAHADQTQAEAALRVEQASNARLLASIAQQNAAVTQLGKDSAAAVAQGDQADDAAVARSKQRDTAAASIVVPTAGAQPDCRTPDDVMAQQGGL